VQRFLGVCGDTLIDSFLVVVRHVRQHAWQDGIVAVYRAPIQPHVGELHRQVANALNGKPYRVYVAPFDARLPKSTEEDAQVDTVVQPDILIACDLQKLDARGMRGAPDWLAEVLSPSTAW